ncbi:MAG: 30S ribosomal protein S17 [Dethiobacter sp.]|jgi:small subunit ribosomal protein S17|nr:30S ribosomal protein S17 [Dethiobacter sp.]
MEKGNCKVRTGRVVSDKMDKTRVAVVQRITRHPLYGKTIRRTKKYKFHDENNESKVGDLVNIVETRPLSKEKRWRLQEILERSRL